MSPRTPTAGGWNRPSSLPHPGFFPAIKNGDIPGWGGGEGEDPQHSACQKVIEAEALGRRHASGPANHSFLAPGVCSELHEG